VFNISGIILIFNGGSSTVSKNSFEILFFHTNFPSNDVLFDVAVVIFSGSPSYLEFKLSIE